MPFEEQQDSKEDLSSFTRLTRITRRMQVEDAFATRLRSPHAGENHDRTKLWELGRVGEMEVSESIELLYEAYQAMNTRDVEAALALMWDDVEWSDGTPDGHVDGREAVRKFLQNEWRRHPPHVEPVGLEDRPNGNIVMHVHELVKDSHGNIQANHTIKHTYTLKDGLIKRMAIGK